MAIAVAVAMGLLSGCAQDATTYERVGEVRTSFYGPFHRLDVAIVVPRDRSEEDLRRTIDRAVTEQLAAYEAQVVLLRLYSDPEEYELFGWTVGKAVHGPNGSLFGRPGDPFETKVTLGPSSSAILKQQEAEWNEAVQRALPEPAAPAPDSSAH